MRSAWGMSVVVVAVLAATARGKDDLATAQCDGPTALHVGDWALYRVKGEREIEELWTVEELTADAALYSIKHGESTQWLVLPRREGTQLAAGVVSFAFSGTNRASSGDRPGRLVPERLLWEAPAANPEGTLKVDLQASAKRVKYTHTWRHKSGSGSEYEAEVQLDPAVPVLGVKRATSTIKGLGKQGVFSETKTTRTLVRHGAAAAGAAPAAPPARIDTPVLLRAKLEANPFAGLQVGAKATFRVARTSCRPIGGTSKHTGKVEVVVTALEGGEATLAFRVVEGQGQVLSQAEYVGKVATTEPAALEPHRWLLGLFPMVGGELGGGTPCKTASRAGSTIRMAFESGVRYEVTFDPASPVGFSASDTHIENGIPESWDEIELRLAP